MGSIYDERISALREVMARFSVDAYIVPTNDPHNSEYICDHYKVREYLSGFTGSAGTLLIIPEKAILWTDGRYFVQAGNELSQSNIELYRSGEKGVPDIYEYLKKELPEDTTIAFDPYIVNMAMAVKIKEIITAKNGKLYDGDDLISAGNIWTDRPDLPVSNVEMLPPDLCGESVERKIERVREFLKEKNAQAVIIAALDEIMWLYNIRGGDIPHNPVSFSYAFIDSEKSYIFVRPDALHDEVNNHFKDNNVTVLDYKDAITFTLKYKKEHPDNCIIYDVKNINSAFGFAIKKEGKSMECPSIIAPMKAVKEESELAFIRDVYIRDSLTLTRFIKLLKEDRPKDLDEFKAGSILDDMRLKTKGCLDLSFETISACGKNAAMMHYSAPEKDSALLGEKGFYLVDSGGQYLGGTTDVTRTISLGSLTYDEKKHFTAVATGMLRLAGAKFLAGSTGRNLDILARGPVWDLAMDYKCGTGHGIGYMLNVHEGPHSIRHRFSEGEREEALKPGMLVSDEPGIYRKDRYGIRTENILEVKKWKDTDDGEFLCFEHLTYVPIDIDALIPDEMPKAEREALNKYHRMVYEKLSPLMDYSESRWLRKVTRKV